MTAGGPVWIRHPGIVHVVADDRFDEDKRLLDTSFPSFFKIEEMALPFPSTLELVKEKQPEATLKALARTTENSTASEGDNVDMKIRRQWSPKPPYAQRIIAAAAEGTLKSAFPEGDNLGVQANAVSPAPSRVMVISSSQFLTNPFAYSGNGPELGGQFAMFGNVGGDQELLIFCGVVGLHHLIAGQLLFDEFVIGLIAIETAHHVVAIAIGVGPVGVVFVAVRFSETDHIEPVPAPLLSIMLGGEQPVDDVGPRSWGTVANEGFDFFGRRGETGQIVSNTADQSDAIGLWGRFQAGFLESRKQERIDRSLNPRFVGGGGEGRRRYVLSRLKGPIFPFEWLIRPERRNRQLRSGRPQGRPGQDRKQTSENRSFFWAYSRRRSFHITLKRT